jgi:molecular chaperone DnaK
MPKSVGIDLGTTNSVVAAIDETGEPIVITLAEGSRLCPSVVGFSKTGERLVGQLAKRQAITNPDRTISSIKRQMGTRYKVSIDGKEFSPEEISAMILTKLRSDAEAFLGEAVTEAVITVPAYFSNAQREATKQAGMIAGLSVVRIVNEPTAAALAFGMGKTGEQTVLVWDLGGGTFDVSIMELDNGLFEVHATSGDTHLGGDDWDIRIIDWMTAEFKKESGIDLTKDRMAMQRLKEASEKAKIELSTLMTASINLPFISSTPEGPAHLELTLTRAQLEDMTQDLIERMIGPTQQAMSDAKMEPKDIQKVLLVGGMTRMPIVQERVRTMFGQEPHKGVNPDEIVAQGAAVQAGVLGGQITTIVLLDVTPLSMGIETQGGVFTKLIERNTTIPTAASQVYTTAVDNQSAVDVHVLQGERDFAIDNKTLGKFQLTGIQSAPRGLPRIEVTFDIDQNGIVHVSAKDLATGNTQKVTLTASSGLAQNEVQRMVQDAEQYRKADEKRREEQEVKNRADQQIYTAMRIAADARGMVPQNLIETVNQAAGRLTAAINNFDTAGAKHGMEDLNTALMTLSNAFYEAKTRQNGNGNSTPARSHAAPDLSHIEALADPGVETSIGASGFDPDAETRIDMDEMLKEEKAGESDFRDV